MIRWHNCPNIAAFWCNIISIFIYFYAIYAAGIRYSHWRDNIGNPRYGLNWNESYLMIYMVCIIISCLFWILMVFSTIFKTGNLSNDYVNLKKSMLILDKNVKYKNIFDIFKRAFSRLYYHFQPFSCIIHIIGGYCLVMPLYLFIQEQLNHDIKINDDPAPYAPELSNLLLGLIILTVRAPSPFVGTCTQLAVYFSFYLFIASLSLILNSLTTLIVTSNLFSHLSTHPFIFICFILNTALVHETTRIRILTRLLQGHGLPLPALTRFCPSILAISLCIISSTLHATLFYNSTPNKTPLRILDISCTILHQLSWLILWLLLAFKSDWTFIFDQSHVIIQTNSDFNDKSLKSSSYQICPIRADVQGHQLFVEGPRSIVSSVQATAAQLSEPANYDYSLGMDSTTVYTCFQPAYNQGPLLLTETPTCLAGDTASLASNPAHSSSTKSSSSATTSSSHNYQTPHIRYTNRMLSPAELLESEERSLDFDKLARKYPITRPSLETRTTISPTNLKNIVEEKNGSTMKSRGEFEYFRSPNMSQRSSTMPSSDSGIGGLSSHGGGAQRTDSSSIYHRPDSRTKLQSNESTTFEEPNLCSDV